jgi:tRNA threonylcarbamoyladenosine biosynthesis protein TsaE
VPELTVATAEDMVGLGLRIATLVRAGDLIVLSGDLGAGKTTLVRGLADGLGARGSIAAGGYR